MQQKTALILFSRTPDAEASVKNFMAGKGVKHNKRVAESIFNRTLKIASHTVLPLYVVDESIQKGGSFGEKIGNAIKNTFQKGYQSVIVIGNDCVQLTTAIINYSAEQLNNNDLVIAPTNKGGVSLLGIAKASFNKHSFEAIPWQTSDVYSSLIDLANSQLSTVFQLPFLNDVNDYKDLIAESKQLNFSDKFRLLIISLFASVKDTATSSIKFLSYQLCYLAGLRAPPSF